MHDSFGLNEAKLIKPGVPDESILVYRLGRRGGWADASTLHQRR